MIVTVTPNPAIDRTLVIPALRAGAVHRATQTIVAAGGKGLNVARALKQLGGVPLAMGLLGGHSGRLLAELVQAEGIESAWTWTDVETRTCVIVAPEDEDATVINEPGQSIKAPMWAQFTADVVQQLGRGRLVCLSGSLPSGCPAAAPGELITAVKQAGCPIWVDSSGTALRQALLAQPDGIKVNIFEAATLLDRPLPTLSETAVLPWARDAGLALHRMGVATVILTLGKWGALLINDGRSWWGQPPPIQLVSSVGSGDAFFAGLAYALDRSEPMETALRSAVAAGSANATTVGGGRFSRETFATLWQQTNVSRLS